MPTNTDGMTGLVHRVALTFVTAVTLGVGDVLRLAKLPAGFALTSITLDNDALGTACVGDVGLLNVGETAVAAIEIGAAALATAGIKTSSSSAARRTAIDPDKSTTVGIVITTAASAALTAGAKVYANIHYRAKQLVEPV
jgi:hypothetical protein